MKERLTSWASWAVVLAVIFILGKCNRALVDENRRLDSVVDALHSKVNHFRTSDSLNAITVKSLNLTLREYKQYRAEDLKTIETLKVKANQVREVIKIVPETKVEFETIVVYRDTGFALNYSNPWVKFCGIAKDTLFKGEISITDTIMPTVWVKPKFRLLGINFGRKVTHLSVVNKNPYAQITSGELTVITKRNGKSK